MFCFCPLLIHKKCRSAMRLPPITMGEPKDSEIIWRDHSTFQTFLRCFLNRFQWLVSVLARMSIVRYRTSNSRYLSASIGHAWLKLTFSSLKGGRLNKNTSLDVTSFYIYFWIVVYDLAILSEILFLAKRTLLKYYYFRTVLLHSVTHLSQKICQLYISFLQTINCPHTI